MVGQWRGSGGDGDLPSGACSSDLRAAILCGEGKGKLVAADKRERREWDGWMVLAKVVAVAANQLRRRRSSSGELGLPRPNEERIN